MFLSDKEYDLIDENIKPMESRTIWFSINQFFLKIK